jgi:hypothetical protein
VDTLPWGQGSVETQSPILAPTIPPPPPVSSQPAGQDAGFTASRACATAAHDTRGVLATLYFGAQSRPLHARCLRFAAKVALCRHARLASGVVGQPSPVGTFTRAGVHREVSVLHHFLLTQALPGAPKRRGGAQQCAAPRETVSPAVVGGRPARGSRRALQSGRAVRWTRVALIRFVGRDARRSVDPHTSPSHVAGMTSATATALAVARTIPALRGAPSDRRSAFAAKRRCAAVNFESFMNMRERMRTHDARRPPTQAGARAGAQPLQPRVQDDAFTAGRRSLPGGWPVASRPASPARLNGIDAARRVRARGVRGPTRP